MISPPLFRPLAYGPLAALWVAHVLSALGTEILNLTLTWMAAQRASSDVALLAMVRFAVAMVVSFLAVGWLERQVPLRLLIGSDLLRVVAGLVPLVVLLPGVDGFGPAVIATALVAASYAAFTPTLLTLLPRLARSREELAGSNALFDGVPRLGRLIGPSVGGLLLAVLSMGVVLGISAALYLLSVGAILLAAKAIRQASEGRPPGARGLAALKIGAQAIWADRSIAYLIVLDVVINIFWVVGISVGAAVLIAEQRPVWGSLQGAAALGAVIGAYGLGNVIGILVIGNLPVRNPIAMNRNGSLLLGVGFSMIGLAAWMPPEWILPMMLLGACVAAPGGPMKELPTITAMQIVIPPDRIGPAIRFKSGVVWVGLLIGSLVASPLIEGVGAGGAIVASGLGMLAMALTGLRVREIAL